MSNAPESWQCIGGPITRPEDGVEVAMYVDWATPDGCCDIRVDNGYLGSSWAKSEVSQFGDGNFKKGISVMLAY
jgi:hypothetical protein